MLSNSLAASWLPSTHAIKETPDGSVGDKSKGFKKERFRLVTQVAMMDGAIK